MSADWPRKTLKECATWYSGGTPRKSNPDFWNGSIPWISAKSLTDFFIQDSDDKVSKLGAKSGTRLVPAETILFIVRGMSLKTEFRMGITSRPVTFNQDLKALVPCKGILPLFLAYAIKSRTNEILGMVGEAGHGTGVLPTDRIERLEIPVPEIIQQKKIVHILKTLDDQIQLNRQINQTLEEMAQTIFKSWFVDFEPVKAKIEAKANGQDPERAAMCAISGKTEEELDNLPLEQLTQLRSTAALFPEELTDSELGPIPMGWAVKYLRDVTEIAYGKNLPTKKLLPEGYPVFGGNGVIGYYKEYLYEEPRVLVACRGAASGKVLRSLPKSFVTNNSLIIDHTKKSYLTSYYLQPCLEQCNLIDFTSGSAQPQVTIANMNPVQIVVPPKVLIEGHTAFISTFYREILSLEQQNNSLSQLRDNLLPKLLSGELDLSQVARW